MVHEPVNIHTLQSYITVISLYTSEFIRLLLSSVTSPLNTSNPVSLEAMHAHASHCSMFHRYVVCFGSWAVPSHFHSHFFFPSFWCMLILIPAVQRMLFLKCSGFFRYFFSILALFAPCGEPSVFALVKSSLDCRLLQWHAYLLESVLLLVECCERVVLYHGEDSLIIHHSCSPWTSRPFYVAELTSAFLFSQNVLNCWFDQS